MFNTKMRYYNFFTLGELDEYGQQKMSDEVKGSVKMAIHTTGQNVQDSILYHNAQYIGLTHNKNINDSYVIDYNGTKLKVTYTGSEGRFKTVFMVKVG